MSLTVYLAYKHDQGIEDPKCRSWHNEYVDATVSVRWLCSCASRGGALGAAAETSRLCGLTDLDAELEQEVGDGLRGGGVVAAKPLSGDERGDCKYLKPSARE